MCKIPCKADIGWICAKAVTILSPVSLLLFATQAVFFLLFYTVPPLRFYNQRFLQTFDYGILFNSSDMLSRLEAPYLSTRGVHAWADNQDFFQLLFSWVHYTPYPHHMLITLYSLAIFLAGLTCGLVLLRSRLFLNIVPFLFWTSPFMLNMNLDLVHTEVFATPLLILAYLGARHGRSRIFWWSLFLAVLCKEEIAVTGAALCVALLASRDSIKVSRTTLMYGAATCAVVFLINQRLVLPVFKEATCEWLSSDYARGSVSDVPINPWFQEFYNNTFSLSFYRLRVLNRQALIYLILLLWPLLPVALRALPLAVVPLAGAAINVLAGGYLIQAQFHYDHSSFGTLMVALLHGLPQVKHRKLTAVYLLAGALIVHFHSVPVRPWIYEAVEARFWDMRKTDSVSVLEQLSRRLPRDTVISADYSSVSYLLSKRKNVFMFPNTFRSGDFGIYGLCDGIHAALDKVPRPELVILTRDVVPSETDHLFLAEGFEHFEIQVKDGSGGFLIHVSDRARRKEQIVQTLRDLGATLITGHPS